MRIARCAPGSWPKARWTRCAPATREVRSRPSQPPRASTAALDDLLWELGRDNPDLLGNAAGDLQEPPRDLDSTWY